MHYFTSNFCMYFDIFICIHINNLVMNNIFHGRKICKNIFYFLKQFFDILKCTSITKISNKTFIHSILYLYIDQTSH